MINEGRIVASGSPEEIIRGGLPGRADADRRPSYMTPSMALMS